MGEQKEAGNGKKGNGNNSFIKWFSELNNKDIAVAGGKGASLAEMYNNKFPIPPGFVITSEAYKHFIDSNEIDEKIKSILSDLDVEDTEELNKASGEIREIMEASELPKELSETILEAYDILDVDKKKFKGSSNALEILKTGHEPPFVAVRSSATTEDLADASFAGQQESFLNVKGNKDLLLKVKKCFSSLFTARAIYYRTKKGFEHDKAYLAVVIQKMIDSKKSGVIFSKNPVKKDESILIEAVWGLGEGIVSGKIKPDNYIVSSDLDNFKVLSSEIANKKIAIVRNSSGENVSVKLTEDMSKKQVLSSYEIKTLAQHAKHLEEHYGKPQDIEFAIFKEEIFIVQSRPITTKASEKSAEEEIDGKILVSGLGASPGVASGSVKIVKDSGDFSKVKKGDVLVTEMTNPDMVITMQKSAGIVTDEGGLTSHASIVSREMGIPCVVGTGEATKKLKDGEIVTVDGNSGKIFEGKAETKLAEIKPVLETKTKIKVIVDLPDFAARAAKTGVKSVGLTRLEGIIASSGKHPLKYVKEKKIEDYVKVLVKGLKKIAEPFEEVWIRSSDIRSDEYRNIDGAPKEVEGNPMMGDHGIRFSLKNIEILKAELTAVKEIADDFPDKKIGLMIPLVICVSELRKTKEIANEIGMPDNTKLGIMVETPAAVQIIHALCDEGIDFVSFGTNDLTQFTLALDRNNSDVQELYDEMNPAVINSLAYVIRVCKKHGVETSICGQAGSKPEMAKFLYQQGIDSISANADAAYKISQVISEIEKTLEESKTEKAVEKKEEKEKEKKVKKDFVVSSAGRENFKVPQMQMVEQEEIRAFGEIAQEIGKKPPVEAVQENTRKIEEEDIEEVALKELGEDDDYLPGYTKDKGNEIPSLNEAIPVESEHLDDTRDSDDKDKVDIEVSSKREGEEKVDEDSNVVPKDKNDEEPKERNAESILVESKDEENHEESNEEDDFVVPKRDSDSRENAGNGNDSGDNNDVGEEWDGERS